MHQMKKKQQNEGPALGSASKFIKSYKYKHKSAGWTEKEEEGEKIKSASCDSHFGGPKFSPKTSRRPGRHRTTCRPAGCLMLIAIFILLLPATCFAYCPFKCLCNDQSLSAECVQVSSLTHVPMTLNPLLKRLTLNQLPMFELSNSLSVYRQLESLNLSSNQLRQIKYQNFNFKPAPSSVLLSQPAGGHSSARNSQEQLAINNEQLAKHLKQAIDKSVAPSSIVSGQPTVSLESSGSSAATSEDEIRFHLRELDLSDNRIDQLGSLSEEDLANEDLEVAVTGSKRLRSHELERLAPFLTLTRLEYLNLAGNRLQRLHQHAFLGLIHLKQLDLSRNQLEFLDRHAFVGLIKLEKLRLNRNKLAGQLFKLGGAFCRAPMNELRQLDLADNVASSGPATLEGGVILQNQILICAPKLASLQLASLQLRYIQVGAFDNLQQLESLDLSGNSLDQVPSDSLSYAQSNLSSTLRVLNLNENPIEFVNANSFGSLWNLQKLSMNSMPRLVSFDLAALPVRQWGDEQASSNIELLTANDGNFKSALKGLLPEHLYERMTQSPSNYAKQQSSINQQPLVLGERGDKPAQLENRLINEHLEELQLRHNPRLQSFHSSLAIRQQDKPGRVRFSKLRLLDLQGASELRELPLESMIDLDGQLDLRVDLSFVSHLNCSSCQMSWLVELARKQRLMIAPAEMQPVELEELQPFDPFRRPQSMPRSLKSRLVLVQSGAGCSWPFSISLVQLVDLESSMAPLFEHCHRHLKPELGPAVVGGPANREEPRGAGGHEGPSGSLLLALVPILVLLALAVRFVFALARARRPASFKWRSPSLDSPSSSTQTNNTNPSRRDEYGQLYADNVVGQIEHVPPRGNLFSRIASQWSGPSSLVAPLRKLALGRTDSHEETGIAGRRRATGGEEQSVEEKWISQDIGDLKHSSGNVVYGGDKMLPADRNWSRQAQQQRPHQKLLADQPTRLLLAMRPQAGELSGGDFIKPAYGCQPTAANVNSVGGNYANCSAPTENERRQLAGLARGATCASHTVHLDKQLSSVPTTHLSRRLPERPIGAAYMPAGEQQQDSHVYVTLDRPIRRTNPTGQATLQARAQPQQQQLAQLQTFQTNCPPVAAGRECKSFGWPSLSSSGCTAGNGEAHEFAKFRYQDGGAHNGRLTQTGSHTMEPIDESVASHLLLLSSGCSSSMSDEQSDRIYDKNCTDFAINNRMAARAPAERQPLPVQMDSIGSVVKKTKKKEDERRSHSRDCQPASNVTGQPDCGPQQAESRNGLMSARDGRQLAPTNCGQQLLAGGELNGRPKQLGSCLQADGKYDANHEAASAADYAADHSPRQPARRTANEPYDGDNNYVINGTLSHNARTLGAKGVAGGKRTDLIGRRLGGGETGEPQRGLGQQEIYSNQYYYCRPAATNQQVSER